MKRLIIIPTLLLGLAPCFAQQKYPSVFSSFGGSFAAGGVQLTYTAGEPLYETLKNSSSILTQGFNQAVYGEVTAVENQVPNDLTLSVYPNPSTGLITLSRASKKTDVLDVQLYDMGGKVRFVGKLQSNSISIDLAKMLNGIYLLKVSAQGKNIQTFKVQKTR